MTYQGQAGTASTGTDPAYVPDREVFDAYTHQQIWELARERLAPAELRRAADAWGSAADALESAFDEHTREITRLSGEWSGIAAAAAVQAANALVRAGDDTAGVCRTLGQLMATNSAAAESVRTAIPPPPQPYRPDPDAAVEAATGAQRRAAHNRTVATATAAAQDAMTFGYNPTIPASGDNVPRFPITLATAPETPGGPKLSVPRETSASNTRPAPPAGSAAESPAATSPAAATTPDPGEDSGLRVAPGRTGDEPQPPSGPVSASAPTTPEAERQPPGTPPDSPPQADSPVGAAGPPAESAPRADAPAPDSTPPPEASAAETTPASGPALGTRPAGSETALQPAAPPADRAAGPAATDLSPRSPASTPTTGTVVPAPAGAPPAQPGVPGAAVPPGSGNPVGGTSGPQPAPGANTSQTRSGPPLAPTSLGGPGFAAPTAPGVPPAPAPGAPSPGSGNSDSAPGSDTSTTGESGAPSPSGMGHLSSEAGHNDPLGRTPPHGAEYGNPNPAEAGRPAPTSPAPATFGSPEGAARGWPGNTRITGFEPCGPNTAESPDRPADLESARGLPRAAPGASTTTTPEISGAGAPGNPAPTPSSMPAAPAPGAGPHSADPAVRLPAGHTDSVGRPAAPGAPEALGPAGSGPNGSTAEHHEHPGQRPARPAPTGVPLPSAPGTPTPRPTGSGRGSPDYLHAPNQELTASDPTVPPVLGEYTDSERAERGDPGGRSH